MAMISNDLISRLKRREYVRFDNDGEYGHDGRTLEITVRTWDEERGWWVETRKYNWDLTGVIILDFIWEPYTVKKSFRRIRSEEIVADIEGTILYLREQDKKYKDSKIAIRYDKNFVEKVERYAKR